MLLENARRLLRELDDTAKVLDVGGGASPFPRADYVLDFVPFDSRGAGSHDNVHLALGPRPRYSSETWIQRDVCDRRPWPFADKQFDFVTCSHLLEDVRDPIWVCSELQRVAKAGYVETPSRVEEQSLGVEHPKYAGFYHHRWLVSVAENRIEFRHKPHLLHSLRAGIVTRVGPGRRITPSHAVTWLDWRESFECREVLELSETEVADELAAFARTARQIPDLVSRRTMAPLDRLKAQIYFARLSVGWR